MEQHPRHIPGQEGSKHLFQHLSHSQGQNLPPFGVSFEGLCCYGFISSAQFQYTVTSYAFSMAKTLFALPFQGRRRQKIQILHGVDGVVRAGEMLLVLGRPGSGCSTFLKTLAGDTHGFHLSEGTNINYEGNNFVVNPICCYYL